MFHKALQPQLRSIPPTPLTLGSLGREVAGDLGTGEMDVAQEKGGRRENSNVE